MWQCKIIFYYDNYVGGAGFTFHSPFDLFRDFFGGDDPFASMFNDPFFGDFGGQALMTTVVRG